MTADQIRKIEDEFFAFDKDGALMEGDGILKTNDRGALVVA